LGICVLVVEDDPLVRFAAAEILVDAGFKTIEAADAAQALELLRSDDRTINILLTDVRMPGRMNGFELSLVAKRKWPELRVIVTSGFFDREEVPSGTNFLPKPYSAADLVTRVRRAAA
jgi:DNA-binding NtrC family response regulator